MYPLKETDLLRRLMDEADLAAGMRLSCAAGWNQTEGDWALFLRSRPEGCFVAEHEGRVVGTVTTIDYGGRVSWIAMVLVDSAMRRRGIGRRLLQTAIDSLAHCESIKLDATPAGKRLYDTLGFKDEYLLSRMAVAAMPQIAPPNARVRAAKRADLPTLAALDSEAFGVERPEVLAGLMAMAPEYAVASEDTDGRIIGFGLGRHGRNREQVGPVVAPDETTAECLAAALFAKMRGAPVLIDVPQRHTAWLRWLRGLGFARERTFVRMYRGPNTYIGLPEHMFAVSGPELG